MHFLAGTRVAFIVICVLIVLAVVSAFIWWERRTKGGRRSP